MANQASFADEKNLMNLLGTVTGVGFVVVVIYGASIGGAQGLHKAALAIIAASACAIIGGLIGFLFGIPRYIRAKDSSGAVSVAGGGSDWGPNTNLEQISDWLTKILVGVTLVQFNEVRKTLEDIAKGLTQGLTGSSEPFAFAMGLILFFLGVGFPLGYLWTRLFLPGAYFRADNLLADIQKDLEVDRADKRLENLIVSHFDLAGPDQSEKLPDAVQKASKEGRTNAFWKAMQARKNGEESPNDRLIQRVISVFNALIKADTAKEYHRTYAERGFAHLLLKENKEAQKSFADAIKYRGTPKYSNERRYELGLIIAKIRDNEDFGSKKPSKMEFKKEILGLIDFVQFDPSTKLLVSTHEDVRDWLKINP
jgi:hypothetical protein